MGTGSKVLLSLYLTGALLTFGSAAHHNPNKFTELNVCNGFASAIGWPFYWSYRLFEPK